jgi:hypothetical protein
MRALLTIVGQVAKYSVQDETLQFGDVTWAEVHQDSEGEGPSLHAADAF